MTAWMLILLLSLTGCASAEDAPEQMITMATEAQAMEDASKEQKNEMIGFTFQGEMVIPGEKLPESVEAAAVHVQHGNTCVGSGMETLYQYEGFDITVHNNSTSDIVYSIYFQSPDIATSEGLSIGDSQESVLEAYGETDEQGGIAWIYSDGNAELIFLMSGNTVAGIEYRMAG